MVKLRNVLLALRHQGPLKRAYRNFLVTGNAWGMFSKRSHLRFDGTRKVTYNTHAGALRAAANMSKKNPTVHFSAYKCVFCDGYHLGKNRQNKTESNAVSI